MSLSVVNGSLRLYRPGGIIKNMAQYSMIRWGRKLLQVFVDEPRNVTNGIENACSGNQRSQEALNRSVEWVSLY